MRRTVFYAGTRNVYPCMAASAKSLLRKTRGIDRVYFIIEDDDFPEPLPDVIRCVNVSGQPWIDTAGPNFGCRWSHMSLMRLAAPYFLPEETRTLYLDVDTIVQRDISELFDMDLNGCVMAAVREPGKSHGVFKYFNAGVLLMDLDEMRAGVSRELIWMVNHRPLAFPDQDAINLRCQGRILELNPIYNAACCTQMPMDAKIVHFAADPRYTESRLFREYLTMKWSDINAREI